MAQVKVRTNNGETQYREARANGTSAVTVKAPASLAADIDFVLPASLPAGTEFLQIDASGNISTNTGTVGSLDDAYNNGSIITADAGPVEAAGAGGFLASHTAPLYGLETTGLERNYRIGAGLNTDIFEIQRGDSDGDYSDDTFDSFFALDGPNLRMGLNTVAPATTAHLVDAAASKLTLESAALNDSSVIFDEGGTAMWEIGYDQSAGGMVIGRLSFANPAVFVEDTTGDVGINENSPDAKLHVTSTSAIASLVETSATGARLALRDTTTSAINQMGIEARGDTELRLVCGGAASLIVEASGQLRGFGASDIITLVDTVEIATSANVTSLTLDSAATGSPLLTLEPLASTNTRGDIAFTSRTASASAPSEGDMWYDQTNHRFEYSEGLQTRAFGTRFGPNFGPIEDKTISTGSVTATSGHLRLTSETGTTDTLDTILVTGAGPKEGDVIVIRAVTTHTITVSDGGGNLRLDAGANKTLNSVNDTLVLMYSAASSVWVQLSFSNNTV